MQDLTRASHRHVREVIESAPSFEALEVRLTCGDRFEYLGFSMKTALMKLG